MCNSYEQRAAWPDYCRALEAAGLGMPAGQSERDLPQADHIQINDTGPVIRATGNLVELVPMRFGFPPAGPRGGPVFNFRSEKRRFHTSNRCLIPASAFFEFTGTKYPKTKYRFSLKDAPMMAIAGLWRDGGAAAPPAFTMLTTAPGPDVAAYHPRQVVVLPPERWAAWIYLTCPESELLKPLPAGVLLVEKVRQGRD